MFHTESTCELRFMKSLVLGYFILPEKAAELGNPLVLSDVNSQPPLQEPR